MHTRRMYNRGLGFLPGVGTTTTRWVWAYTRTAFGRCVNKVQDGQGIGGMYTKGYGYFVIQHTSSKQKMSLSNRQREQASIWEPEFQT